MSTAERGKRCDERAGQDGIGTDVLGWPDWSGRVHARVHVERGCDRAGDAARSG